MLTKPSCASCTDKHFGRCMLGRNEGDFTWAEIGTILVLAIAPSLSMFATGAYFGLFSRVPHFGLAIVFGPLCLYFGKFMSWIELRTHRPRLPRARVWKIGQPVSQSLPNQQSVYSERLPICGFSTHTGKDRSGINA